MRTIEFISPIEAIRGNLSGSQDLRYSVSNLMSKGVNGNSYSPSQYTPRFVGSKKTLSGKKYYSIKKATTTKVTAAQKSRWATFGASNTAALQAMGDAGVLAKIRALRNAGALVASTNRGALASLIYEVIINEEESTSLSGGGVTLTIYNGYAGAEGGGDFYITPDARYTPYLV